MTTRIDHLQAGRASQRIRFGPAAAIGLALLVLVLGLAIALVVGKVQQGPADQGVSAPQAAAKIPTLTWRDDYGTRHPEARP